MKEIALDMSQDSHVGLAGVDMSSWGMSSISASGAIFEMHGGFRTRIVLGSYGIHGLWASQEN